MQDWDTGSTAELPPWAEGMNHPRLCQARGFDVTGNVWTWCLNVFRDLVSSLEDVTELGGGPHRSIRGASWLLRIPGIFRSASRHWSVPGARVGILGFRLALVRSG
jgi:formylglycine-generating enzyme required for sulfatase activity